jgi:hypothetical protein
MTTARLLRPGTKALAVCGLLTAHALLSFTATLDASATFDEVLHIASGLSYWRFDDYRLQPENGNLPQRWCALPLVLTGCPYPADEAAWRQGDSFRLGQRLLYGTGQDAARLLAMARGMSVLWSTALCLVVFLWSRSLFGVGGGLVSLALAALWPAVVAHGPLATSDVCGALFFTLGAWSLWELVNRVSMRSLCGTAFSVGLAAIAKHSCMLLAPLGLIFLGVVIASGRPIPIRVGAWSGDAKTLSSRIQVAAAALAVPLVAAVFFIWASCGFRYLPAPDGDKGLDYYWFDSLAECAVHGRGLGMLCDFLASRQLLPEAWLWGVSYMAARSSHRYAFAIGEHSVFGWWWFFPLCLAIKNTLPALALCGWGLVRQVAAIAADLKARLPLRGEHWGSVPLVIMLAVLWPIFLTSHLNIGERHLLPSYPPLMILAGSTWRAANSRRLKGLVVLFLGLHAADVMSHWPASLAYFNQIVPRGRAHEWLVDSSLDWGQDLDRLGAWLDRHGRPDEPVYVTYSGAAPVVAAVPRGEVPGFPRDWGLRQELQPGIYCVSATALQGIADRPRGPWCRAFEAAYRETGRWLGDPAARGDEAATLALLRSLVRDRDELGLALCGDAPTSGDLVIAAFNILQAGRLKAYLRQREPDLSIGGSILVYRLDAVAIDQALRGLPAESAEQSWFERERYGTADELIRQGRRHLDGNRCDAALAIFETATRLYPGDPRTWDGLAVARRCLGDGAGAGLAARHRDRLRARLAAAEVAR